MRTHTAHLQTILTRDAASHKKSDNNKNMRWEFFFISFHTFSCQLIIRSLIRVKICWCNGKKKQQQIIMSMRWECVNRKKVKEESFSLFLFISSSCMNVHPLYNRFHVLYSLSWVLLRLNSRLSIELKWAQSNFFIFIAASAEFATFFDVSSHKYNLKLVEGVEGLHQKILEGI